VAQGRDAGLEAYDSYAEAAVMQMRRLAPQIVRQDDRRVGVWAARTTWAVKA
jgi:hypothetical protein